MTVRRLRLADVCDINPRLSHDHGLADDTLVSFVPMAAVDEVAGAIAAPQIRAFSEVRKGYTAFRERDVLFAKITPCMENGKAALARGLIGGVGFGSTEFHVLRAGPLVLPEWLRYFVRREAFRQEAKRNFTGTAGQQRVPTSFLSNTEIPVPRLDEQRRVVDLLSRAERILRLRREAQAKAQAIIPVLFLDMFGDPATNPKGWTVQPLGSLADVQGGLQVTRAREALPIERPYLRVANVYRDSLDLAEIKTIRMTEAEWLRTALKPGDLLVVEGHGNPQEVGRVAVWSDQISDCTHQNHLIRARPDPTRLLPSYACALLNSASGRQALVRSGKTTSGLSTISTRNVKETQAMLPPLESQKRFDKRGSAVRDIIVQQEAATKRAEATFQSLLAHAFSGRASEI